MNESLVHTVFSVENIGLPFGTSVEANGVPLDTVSRGRHFPHRGSSTTPLLRYAAIAQIAQCSIDHSVSGSQFAAQMTNRVTPRMLYQPIPDPFYFYCYSLIALFSHLSSRTYLASKS